MGRTNFSGPLYGAKATLFGVTAAASTGSSAVFSGARVPSGEDWYVTELSLYRASTGSTSLVISLHDDSTLVTTVGVGGSSLAGAGSVTILAADGGEYEGTRIASGSVLTLSHSSHAGPNAGLTVVVRGYTRFIDSTRAG